MSIMGHMGAIYPGLPRQYQRGHLFCLRVVKTKGTIKAAGFILSSVVAHVVTKTWTLGSCV